MRGFEWGGSEELWYRTARLAAVSGHETVCAVNNNLMRSPKIEKLREDGARIIEIRTDGSSSLPARLWRRAVSPFRQISSFAPDVIVLNAGDTYGWTHAPGLYRWLCQMIQRGHRLDFLLHSYQESRLPNPWEQSVAKSVWPRARSVGFPSQELLEAAERQLLTALPNGHTFVNPVNLRNHELLPWPQDSVARMATVSRLDMLKGIDVLLRVLSRPNWRNRLWSLEIYGNGPNTHYLRHLATYLGHDNRVRFLGHTDDVGQVWRQNQLFILPSRVEGLPLALVEASLCGRPSVATDVGGIRRWLGGGTLGFVAEAATEWSLNQAMENAWCRRGDWAEMGRAARVRALSWYGEAPEARLLQRLVAVIDAQGRSHTVNAEISATLQSNLDSRVQTVSNA